MSTASVSFKKFPRHANNPKRFAFTLGLLVIFFFTTLFILSPSLRGSDQYWYVGDIERVVLQDGLYKSNSVFPASMPNDINELPRPWVQNKPVSYIVLMLAYITRNGHLAWLIFNTICLFASALMTARILKVTPRKLLLFIGIFTFFPLNFYLASQALPEIFIMFLIAVIHYLLLSARLNVVNMLLLGFVTGLLISQRPNYLLLIPIVPILLYIIQKRSSLLFSAMFLIVACGLTFCSTLMFDEHLVKSPTMLDTVINNVPGETNMGSFLYAYDNSNIGFVDLVQIIFKKFIGAMVIQFEILGISSLMFYLINVMLIAIPVLFFLSKMKRPSNTTALVFIGIHFLTVILFYNQYRYAAAIIPSLFILNIRMIRSGKWVFINNVTTGVVVFVCFAVMSFGIGYQVRNDAIADDRINSEIKQLAAKHQFKSLMCEWNNGGCLSVGYSLSPKTVFYFPKDYSAQEWTASAKKLNATHGIVYSKSGVYNKLKPYIINKQEIQNSDIVFFEVDLSKLN